MTKPRLDRLAVVTATINPARAAACLTSWIDRAAFDPQWVIVWNGTHKVEVPEGAWTPAANAAIGGATILCYPEILGVVPAFALGVAEALHRGATIIVCLHDDVRIDEDGWDARVLEHFNRTPTCGLAGFGGGIALGDADLYQQPYEAHQLARQGFVSNLQDAEAHGARVTHAVPVACLDGFCQIGRRAFWEGWYQDGHGRLQSADPPDPWNLFGVMARWGMTHHAYDAALGCFARRLGWDAWMLPIRCHHFGGQTAVGEPRYQAWAEGIVPGGDRTFWELAHREVYDQFRDVLPIRI